MSEHRLNLVSRIGNWPFLGMIYLYRLTLSHVMGGQCRFEPTCSRFGIDAYKMYGPIKGTRMTIGRILRCHPFSKGGYDPVPFPDGKEHAQYNDSSSALSEQQTRNESEQDS